MRNPRITPLHGVYSNPPGVTLTIPSSGTLDSVIEQTYTDSPLPWAARFRIAVDLVLAVRFLHSQAPVVALQGLDAHSILLNENYRDANATAPIVQLDMSAMNNQRWLNSVFAPRPYLPSVQQISQTAQESTIKLSPHASDIYSLGVVLLQLWRNEPVSDFVSRVRHKLPPVPYYSPESIGFLAFEQMIAACVCDDPAMRPQIDQLIAKLASIAQHMELSTASKILDANAPSLRWRRLKTLQIATSSEVSFPISTLCQSTSNSLIPYGSIKISPSALQFEETVVWAGGADGVLYGIPFSKPNALSSQQHSTPSTSTMQSLHWATVSPSVLSAASVQYRMPTFGPETRNSRRRIIGAVTTHRHIWCLMSTGTISVLDPSRFAIVSHVEAGPSLSIAAFEDTIYVGGTSGLLSAFDGTTCKRLRHREVANLPITAIAASGKFVWVSLSDDTGASSAVLLCLDSQSLQDEIRYQHTLEDTITSLCLTPFSESPNTELVWAGGYSGAVEALKVSLPSLTDPQLKVEPLISFPSAHKTRIHSLIWNGYFVYSSSHDSVIAWKPNASGLLSLLNVPSNDIVSSSVLEKSCLITGHKNGTITIWASL